MISVIIPVYNSAAYLKRCIDSVLSQTYSDFELILVNDGSTDDSCKICDEYALKDNRIIVLHQVNSGVSSARNKGLDYAHGEWISFVDSDDYVKPNYFQNMIDKTGENHDIIIGGFEKIDGAGNIIELLKWENAEYDSKDLYIILQKLKLYNYGYPFAKLFKNDIISTNTVRFNTNIKMFEDSIFLMEYIYGRSVKLVDATDYVYCFVAQSLSNKLHNFESEYNAFISLYDIAKNIYGLNISDLKERYNALGFRIAVLHNRSIISLYRNKTNNQLHKLKSYPKDSWELYKHFHQPSGIKLIMKNTLLGNLLLGNFMYKILYSFIK